MFDGGFITRLQRALDTDAEGEDLIRVAYEIRTKIDPPVFIASKEHLEQVIKERVNVIQLRKIVLEPKGRYVVKADIAEGSAINWQIWYIEGQEEKYITSFKNHDDIENHCEKLNAEHLIKLILKELWLKS